MKDLYVVSENVYVDYFLEGMFWHSLCMGKFAEDHDFLNDNLN